MRGISFVVNKVELGNAARKNVGSVITSDDPTLTGFDGLLGLSFVGDFGISVDYRRIRRRTRAVRVGR